MEKRCRGRGKLADPAELAALRGLLLGDPSEGRQQRAKCLGDFRLLSSIRVNNLDPILPCRTLHAQDHGIRKPGHQTLAGCPERPLKARRAIQRTGHAFEQVQSFATKGTDYL